MKSLKIDIRKNEIYIRSRPDDVTVWAGLMHKYTLQFEIIYIIMYIYNILNYRCHVDGTDDGASSTLTTRLPLSDP